MHDLCELIGVPIEGTHYRAAGVNHQAWLIEWSRDGQDLYPRLRDRDRAPTPSSSAGSGSRSSAASATTPPRRASTPSEYLSWFLRSDEQIERYRLEPLEYLGISEENVAEFERGAGGARRGRRAASSRRARRSTHRRSSTRSLTGTQREIHANVVNRGLIDNLPEGAVVEVPAPVDGVGRAPDRGRARSRGRAPRSTARTCRSAELTVEAARTGDPDLVRQAVLVDPNASSTLTPEQIWELCDELTAAHARPAARGPARAVPAGAP